MVTSLLVPIEEGRDELLIRAQGLGPAVEQAPAFLGERVDPLGGSGRVVAPLGGDDSVLLEGAQDAVEVAHVDPRLARQLGDLLEQLVPVRRALREQLEESRLPEPLDARAHGPLARADPAAGSGAAEPVAMASHDTTCKSHMF